PAAVPVQRRPASVEQPTGDERAGRHVRALDVVTIEERLIVAGRLRANLRGDERRWIWILSSVEEYLAIGREPDQIAAFVVAVVEIASAGRELLERADRQRPPPQMICGQRIRDGDGGRRPDNRDRRDRDV